MPFLRNLRSNLIQQQSNKVYHNEEPEGDAAERYSTYTRKNRTRSLVNESNSNNFHQISSANDNVVRVYLNSSSTAAGTQREAKKKPAAVTRSDTFTKPSDKLVRSDTFTFKDDEMDEKSNYSTYTRSKKADKKSSYVDSDTYRKPEKERIKQQVASPNTKRIKPKRVESLIKRFEKNFLRRDKTPKEPKEPKEVKEYSPISNSSTDSLKRIKKIFSSNKKITRDVGIDCKIDDDIEYQNRLNTLRKSSIKSLMSDRISRPRKIYYDNSDQKRRESIKSLERKKLRGDEIYENVGRKINPAPIRVELNTRRGSKLNNKPIGIASPQQHRPSITSISSIDSRAREPKKQIIKPIRVEFYKPTVPNSRGGTVSTVHNDNINLKEAKSEKLSFREYRETLKARTNKPTTDHDDQLEQSYQQSFFVPF